jgi:hypothetical protein
MASRAWRNAAANECPESQRKAGKGVNPAG